MPSTLSDATDLIDGLRYDRTAERGLVHRAAVGEVFLTDSRELPGGYVAAAQLPAWHAYWTDHPEWWSGPHRPAYFDPLAVLECVRQAGVYAAHRHLDVPLDAAFLVHEMSVRVDRPDALRADGSGELAVPTALEVRRRGSGPVRAIGYDCQLLAAGTPAGSARIQVSLASPAEYETLRGQQRDGPAPTTTGVSADRTGLVEPADVGRSSPANVVLAAAQRSNGHVTADVRPFFGNPGLFEHSYDHIPGMVLLEAARQLALLLRPRARTGPAYPLRLAGTFSRFVELDAPVVATATGPEPATTVHFEQSGETVAEVAVVLAEVGR